MVKDKRKASRRSIRYTAWIALEAEQQRECILFDISDTGAKLEVEGADKIPENFVLLLSNRGAPKRKCMVVWRGEGQIGVEFDRRLPPISPNAQLGNRPGDAGGKKKPQAAAEPTPEPAETA